MIIHCGVGYLIDMEFAIFEMILLALIRIGTIIFHNEVIQPFTGYTTVIFFFFFVASRYKIEKTNRQ